MERKHVVAKPISTAPKKNEKRELYAEICYFYPQYTLQEASKLPARDLNLLLKVAHKQEAVKFYNLTQIVASPHTKKGKGVDTLSKHFKEIINK